MEPSLPQGLCDEDNVGNFLHTLALREAVNYFSMTTLRDRLVKIG